ncbi:MAG TPA: aminotransferase class I/II-fold pyridoxal phosphate-dependent enzyme, partial [Solirubrobacteraceae bacterium]|nr:aminotransferase class I/II-fold pyridoxal phosphate-dependent enzyme [Solirubrobacteraceae bacterium]
LNGAAQGYALLAALAPERPTIVHPHFTEPDRALPAAAQVVLAEPWHPRVADVPAGADLVIVGRPVNPTGVLPDTTELRAMAERRTVVVDEAFLPFTPERSLADGGAPPNTIVLRSITKHLAIPGLRAGYLVGPADVAARLRDARPGWSVNALALAALAAHAERGDDPELPHRTAAAREELASQLRALGITIHDGAANFLLATVPEGARVVQQLRTDYGIAVRPAGTFPGLTPDHVRITVRGGADDERLIAALRTLV